MNDYEIAKMTLGWLMGVVITSFIIGWSAFIEHVIVYLSVMILMYTLYGLFKDIVQ